MKYNFSFLFSFFFFLNAYALDSVSNIDISFSVQPKNMCLAVGEKSHKLTCLAKCEKSDSVNVLYRWYESDQLGNRKEQITSDWSSTPECEVVISEGDSSYIHYFVCAASVDKSNITYSNVVAVACSGLPVIYISTDIPTSEITKEEYVQSEFAIVYPDGMKEEVSMTKKGIKGRGNTSWQHPKKSYSLSFDKKRSFFNLPKSKKWCLIANYADKTLLRNNIASILGQKGLYDSEWNPSFVSVDLVMNNVYKGNYILCEKIDIEKGRVDVQDISDCTLDKIEKESYLDMNGDGNIDLNDGGFIVEIDQRKDADFYFKSKKGVFFALKDPDEVDETIQNHVKEIIQTAENVLFSENFTDSIKGWGSKIDKLSVVDWYIINELGKNRDARSYSSIYMFYNPVDMKLHWGPLWDFDYAFGNDGVTDCGKSNGFYISGNKWISRMFQDEEFVILLKNRWNEKKDSLLFVINEKIQTLADEIKISADLNFMRWKILGKNIVPNPDGYADRKTYQSEVDYLKEWLMERYKWLDKSLNGILIPDFSSLTILPKTYDGTNKAFYSGNIGVVNAASTSNDDVSIKLSSAKYDSKDVDASQVKVTFALQGSDKRKYSLVATTQIFEATIIPKEIDVRWEDTIIAYDGYPHVPMAIPVGVLESDTCLLIVDGEQIEEGEYWATVYDVDNKNYSLPNDKQVLFYIKKENNENTGLFDVLSCFHSDCYDMEIYDMNGRFIGKVVRGNNLIENLHGLYIVRIHGEGCDRCMYVDFR